MSVVKHLKLPNWDVGTTSASTLFVETEAKQSEIISEARKIIKKDASNVWALFVYSRHKKKVQWECPLCSDPLNFGKTKSVLSLKLRVLRHLGTCHMTCRFNFEEHLYAEWRFLQDEFGKNIHILQTVPKSVKQMEKHRSSVNFVTHLDDSGLVEVFGANAFCEICCEGLSSLDHLRKHGELENKLSFSEFFQCDEKSIDEYPFPHPLLGYGYEESCSEQQTTSTGTAAYTWCCRIPSCWNYILSSFPTITILKAHALRHFEEFHGGLFNEGLFENEWTIIHAESDLTHIDLRRQRTTVMDVACPDEFVHPSTRHLIPFECHGHRVCQFCFFTSSDEKKFRRHLRRHGYREEKKPFLHPESLDYGVPAVRELMVDFCEYLHPVHYLYGDKSVYKGQKKLWEKRKEDLELDLSHSQSTSVEFVDDEILEHLDRNQRDGENMEEQEQDARQDNGDEDDYTKEDEERIGDGRKKDSEEKELMNNMELEFDQETSDGDGKAVATKNKLDDVALPDEIKRNKAKVHDDQDRYDHTKEIVMRKEEEMVDRVLEEDERMNEEDLELDKENSEKSQTEEKMIKKNKDQVSVLHEKKRGKKRKEMYREGDEGEHEDEVKRNKKTCKRNQKEQEKNNKVRKENRKLVEVPKDGKKGEVEDKPVSEFSSAMHRTPQEEEEEPEHQQELMEMDGENTLLVNVNHQRKPMDEEDTVLVGKDSSFGEVTVAEDVVSECEESTVVTLSEEKKVKKRVSWAPEELEASTEKCDQSVSNLEKVVVERVEEQSKKNYKCQLCSSKFPSVVLVTAHLREVHTVTTVVEELYVPVESQDLSSVRQQFPPAIEENPVVPQDVSAMAGPPQDSESDSAVADSIGSIDASVPDELVENRSAPAGKRNLRRVQPGRSSKCDSPRVSVGTQKSPAPKKACQSSILNEVQKHQKINSSISPVRSSSDHSVSSATDEKNVLTQTSSCRSRLRRSVSRADTQTQDVSSESSIVGELMSYVQEGGDREFATRAVIRLLHKLDNKEGVLESLRNALISGGHSSTQCVTIPRTVDGRITVGDKVILPHVVYVGIWRSANVTAKELRKLPCCVTTRDDPFVCVNPFHYSLLSVSTVVTKLQSYLQKCVNLDYANKAIHHLVNKLEDAEQVDSLLNILEMRGKLPTPCLTIGRTGSRGRVRIGGKMEHPHVTYASIWRWPNVTKDKLRKLECCSTSDEHTICINPYHYERVSPDEVRCLPGVHELMTYAQKGVDLECAKKAAQYVVKRLKSGIHLDYLLNALKSDGKDANRCVTIPRTKDGRIWIDGSRTIYYVLFTRIWRWPNVEWNELRRLPCCTSSPGDAYVCVNPYHYQKVVGTSTETSVNVSARSSLTRESPSESGQCTPGKKAKWDTSAWSDTDDEKSDSTEECRARREIETEEEKEAEQDGDMEEMRRETSTTDNMKCAADMEELEKDLYIPSGSSSPIDLNIRSLIIDWDSDEVSTDGEGYGVEKPVNEEETGSARETEGKQKRIENNVPEEPSPKRRRRSVQQRTQKETSVRDEEEESAEKNRCSLKNTPRRVVKSPSVNVDPVLLSHRRNGRSGKLFDMSPPSRESIGKEKGADSERKK